MKFFRLDLLTLLISLFILNSCKNQDTIGLGVNASNQLNGNLIDTSTIFINTIPDDSVLTSTIGQKVPMAYFKDPIFGTTEANIALDLNLPGGTAFTPLVGTVTIDSALLIMKYAPGFYGDSIASRYKVNVYQLNERINGSYYSNKFWQFNNGTLLGTKSFFSRTNDSVRLVKTVPGKSDVITKVSPQLRIPIDKNFINNIFFNAPSSQLATNLAFKNAVKGLYVTLDKAQTTGAGGSFLFAPDSLARIEVYYRRTDGSIIDTNSIVLGNTVHAAEVKHTYSTGIQTELANQNTTIPRNTFYLQGLAGLRAKISFPYLKKIVEKVGSDIVLNRAELVVTPVAGSTIPFAPAPQISMYRYDLAHQRVPLTDASTDPRSNGFGFGGFYSTTTNDYHFNITAYIEDLLRGKTTDNGTFLGVVDIRDGQLSYNVSATTAARTFAIGGDLTSPYRIKLNIIYTKLTK